MTNRSFFIGTSHKLAAYIEQELKMQRGIHFRFSKVVPSCKVLTLWLVINATYTRRVMGMTKELSQVARLEKGSFIRAEWGGEGVIELQIPKPSYLWKSPQVSKLDSQDGVKTAVGLDTQNQTAIADFANPITSHALIAGLSGSGKTELQRLITFQLAMQNQPNEVKFLLFDVADKGIAWNGFDDLPHLMHGIISDVPTALSAMDWLTGEMLNRAETRRTMPRLFCFIDEIQELAQEPRFVKPTETLARRGRKWGISLILATQRPTKESMGSMNIKANLGLRLCGKVTSGQESLWATDLPQANAEGLLGPGDMLLCKPGVVQRIATPLLTREDLARLPRNGHDRLDLKPQDSEPQETQPGRRRDPLNAKIVAYCLLHKDTSQRELNRQFSIGFPKAQRILEFARELRAELLRLTATKCNVYA